MASDLQATAILVVGLIVYFVPSYLGKDKRNSGAIFALNLLLGWTLIGWVVALVWALTVDAASPRAGMQSSQPWTCTVCRGRLRYGNKFCPTCGTQINGPTAR